MNKRISLSLEEKTLEELNKLKRKEFYDKSFADLYRFVIKQGIAAIKSAPKKGE